MNHNVKKILGVLLLIEKMLYSTSGKTSVVNPS